MNRSAATNKAWIAVVGDFMGAGKNTLILAVDRELERSCSRICSAIILND
jgi:hypothetical protein